MHVSSRPKKSRLLPDGAENTQVAEAVGDKLPKYLWLRQETRFRIFPTANTSWDFSYVALKQGIMISKQLNAYKSVTFLEARES